MLHNLPMLTQLERGRISQNNFLQCCVEVRKVMSGISAEGWIVVCKVSKAEMSNLSGGHTVHNPDGWARTLYSQNYWWHKCVFVGEWRQVRLVVFEVLWNLTTVSQSTTLDPNAIAVAKHGCHEKNGNNHFWSSTNRLLSGDTISPSDGCPFLGHGPAFGKCNLGNGSGHELIHWMEASSLASWIFPSVQISIRGRLEDACSMFAALLWLQATWLWACRALPAPRLQDELGNPWFINKEPGQK